MDFLSHELCVQLKDAGFPQPEISAGQFWYVYPTGDGRFSDIQLAVAFKEENGDDFLIRLCDGGIVYCENDCDYMVFAPTIEDILRELGSGWKLSVEDKGNEENGSVKLIWKLTSPLNSLVPVRTFYSMYVPTVLVVGFLYLKKWNPNGWGEAL